MTGLTVQNGKGKILLPVMAVCTVLVACDLFNIFDGVGFVKKQAHSLLPGVFGEDKFRK